LQNKIAFLSPKRQTLAIFKSRKERIMSAIGTFTYRLPQESQEILDFLATHPKTQEQLNSAKNRAEIEKIHRVVAGALKGSALKAEGMSEIIETAALRLKTYVVPEFISELTEALQECAEKVPLPRKERAPQSQPIETIVSNGPQWKFPEKKTEILSFLQSHNLTKSLPQDSKSVQQAIRQVHQVMAQTFLNQTCSNEKMSENVDSIVHHYYKRLELTSNTERSFKQKLIIALQQCAKKDPSPLQEGSPRKRSRTEC